MKPLKTIATALQLASALFSLFMWISPLAQADELVVPVGHQGADKASLDRPKVGMKSDAVETKFGAPLKKTAPVGKPPISSWEYPYYTVYFESDRVIHTVLKPTPDEPTPATEAPSAATPAIPATPAPATETATVAAPADASVTEAPATPATVAPEAKMETAPIATDADAAETDTAPTPANPEPAR